MTCDLLLKTQCVIAAFSKMIVVNFFQIWDGFDFVSQMNRVPPAEKSFRIFFSAFIDVQGGNETQIFPNFRLSGVAPKFETLKKSAKSVTRRIKRNPFAPLNFLSATNFPNKFTDRSKMRSEEKEEKKSVAQNKFKP